jgi:glycogen operon protein
MNDANSRSASIWSGELGTQISLDGVHFAVSAPLAERVELCLFDASGRHEGERIPLSRSSRGAWTVFVAGLRAGQLYGYRVHGPWSPGTGLRFNPAKLLLDPYARQIVGEVGDETLLVDHQAENPQLPDMRDSASNCPKSCVVEELAALAPQSHVHVPPPDTVLYELHLRGMTRCHSLVPENLRGTYAALGQDSVLKHLKQLGVTSLSFMPLMQSLTESRLLRLGLSNYWGYNPVGWFCPDPRFWSGRPGTTPAGECREMVADLHRHGFEVVLDVVFNHTAEGGIGGPSLNLRGLANEAHYISDPGHPGTSANWSGCGNTLRVADTGTLRLVLDAMRWWVSRIGIDGFRFDLAPTLGRGRDGRFDAGGAFFAALAQDPLLARTKWIAEPWDLGPDGYQLGGFPSDWLEWNDRFRDTVRRFWLTRDVNRGRLAQVFAGTSECFHYGSRPVQASVNFVSAHDGFTLRDLVEFSARHNEANGEENRDGHSANFSINLGHEGPSQDPQVTAARRRLQRALLATLLLAPGTPMLCSGDELGRTQRGNNNAYCQDNEISWLDWDRADHELSAFVGVLLDLRRSSSALRSTKWPEAEELRWHGPKGEMLSGGDWDQMGVSALSVVICSTDGSAIALLLNPGDHDLDFLVPGPGNGHWRAAIEGGDTFPGSSAGHWRVPGRAAGVLSWKEN